MKKQLFLGKKKFAKELQQLVCFFSTFFHFLVKKRNNAEKKAKKKKKKVERKKQLFLEKTNARNVETLLRQQSKKVLQKVFAGKKKSTQTLKCAVQSRADNQNRMFVAVITLVFCTLKVRKQKKKL